MIRYERTGEFRVPTNGEWFECAGLDDDRNYRPGKPLEAGVFLESDPAWILRRIESPDPPPPARPATADIVRQLEAHRDCHTVLIPEAIRRVRVYDDALRAVRATEHLGPEAQALALAVRAILDGDGA